MGIKWDPKKHGKEDKKVVEFGKQKKPYSVDEALDRTKELINDENTETVVVIYRSKDDDMFYLAGSARRCYTLSDMNWDIDQVKASLTFGDTCEMYG